MIHFLSEAFWFCVCIIFLVVAWLASERAEDRREDREAREAAREMEWKRMNDQP